MQTLSSLFTGNGSIKVEVEPDAHANRGGGGTPVVVTVGEEGGFAVVESASEYEARTGVDPNGNGPEIVITFDPSSSCPLLIPSEPQSV